MPEQVIDLVQHRLDWKNWMDKLIAGRNWDGGQPLTLAGKVTSVALSKLGN